MLIVTVQHVNDETGEVVTRVFTSGSTYPYETAQFMDHVKNSSMALEYPGRNDD